MTVDPAVDVFAERAAVEEIVARHHSPLGEAAARANALIEQRFHVDLMDAQVRVAFRTTDLGKYRIAVTLFCPTRLAETLENAITCEVMSYLHRVAQRQRREETAPRDRPGDGAGDSGS